MIATAGGYLPSVLVLPSAFLPLPFQPTLITIGSVVLLDAVAAHHASVPLVLSHGFASRQISTRPPGRSSG